MSSGAPRQASGRSTYGPATDVPQAHMAEGRRVAFIRGINVGGRNCVDMAGLRTVMTAAGFGNVRTYIQSGNVVYDARPGDHGGAAALADDADTISSLLAQHVGFAPRVVVLAAADVARHLAATPYGDADPAKAFIVFVDGDPRALGDLGTSATAGEKWTLGDGVVHLHCPDGLGRSRLAARLANGQPPTTTRNLRTVAATLALRSD